ncbi:hypothetical protein BC835DRAFT_1508901 [Cytidiella melzeri]|nr:hypothetical protein BC835DRAFT_1508901 [Cytidiella melzeri]
MSDNCSNYGSANGSACACPPGFGGSDCSQPACGGNIFQGSGRSLVPAPTATNSFPNLTASGCSCEDGWTGTVCNVCQTAQACQAGFASSSSSSSSVTGLGVPDGQNDTLTCNTASRVYAASHMSCSVQNQMLQALYPLDSTLTILRNLNSSFTPLPNVTGFGESGSIYAQLFYSGEEQFYCTADSCTQNIGNNSDSSDWNCQNLKCTCIPGATFCGGVPITNITSTIDGLTGAVEISCNAPAMQNGVTSTSCAFKQLLINQVFGSSGLSLAGCTFGECVAQAVIDTTPSNSTSLDSSSHGPSLSGGVIAGLAVVGSLIGIALAFLVFGCYRQRQARRASGASSVYRTDGIGIVWTNVSYFVSTRHGLSVLSRRDRAETETKTVLDNVSGQLAPGHTMAILGPSGAGKTTLIEILAGKNKVGRMNGEVEFPVTGSCSREPTVGFVPQQDILPATLTVHEAILFAARLRLPESIPLSEQLARVDDVIEKLGLSAVRNVRIGDGEKRGISGGEMRRVSIGLELVARPDILILDEPTSGLDSVSASNVARVLHGLAHDRENPTAVIASIHQPSSQLYQTFDQVLLLSHGRALYLGAGGLAPATYFSSKGIAYQEGYNVADYLLDVASDPPVALFQPNSPKELDSGQAVEKVHSELEKGYGSSQLKISTTSTSKSSRSPPNCATTFLTQLEVLSGREWKLLQRDYTLFVTHVLVSAILGVFVGGLYFHTGITIAGFQSRVGCLFFLGALVAFSTLSALYRVVETRPLFLRERSASYYSPTSWLLSRFIFDVVPLRIIPTIVVATITYWMAGLAQDAAHFFKFLFILVLYTLAMTLFNFLLGCIFTNGGIAILLSALLALYQMTYAGFFVHLNDIPPVLRWLQWLCPLKYTLEALSVNEVGSGLMIQDSLEGVPVNVSASLIMNLLFGFGSNNYYRDVLVLFAFIAGFGSGVILVVYFKARERR